MRIAKRILSIVLSLVLVITFMQGIGTITVNAANELEIDLMTGAVQGLNIGSVVSEISIKKAAVANDIVAYNNVSFIFNNGKYDLDPDDVIEAGTDYSMTIKFEVTNPVALNGVTSAKINVLGKKYDASMPDYVTGSVLVKDNEVTIKATLRSYPKQISSEQIMRLAWNLVYNNAADTTPIILNPKDAQFTAGKISWYYTEDDGKTKKSVSRIDKLIDGIKSYYIAEVKLTAKDGYCFREYTKDEIATWSTPIDKYTCKVGTNKKEMTVTISRLIPIDGVNTQINSITELVLDTETEFKMPADKSKAFAADIIRYCTQAYIPLYCLVGINGGIAQPFNDINSSSYYSYWKLFDYSGQEYKANAEISVGQLCYLAFPLSTISGAMAKRYKYVDNHNLFSLYEFDMATNPDIPSTVKTKTNGGYWVVKVNVVSNDATIRNPSGSYNYPKFTFANGKYKVTNTAVNTELWAGSTGKDGKNAETIGYATAIIGKTISGNSLEGVAVDGPMVYMAWAHSVGNGPLSSPVVYKYYNPKEATSGNLTGGEIVFNIPQKPMAGREVYKSSIVYARQASEQIMTAANANKIFYYWVSSSSNGFEYNNGTSVFSGQAAYALKVYIPRRDGFYLTGAKAKFKFGSGTPEETLEGEIYPDESGKFFCAVIYYPITERVGFITSSKVYKKLYFNNLEEPINGATVPKNIELTQSTARFVNFVTAKWFEDGKDFYGSTFTVGKRYELQIMLNGTKGWIGSNNAVVQQLVGDSKYCVSAIANAADQTIVLRYNFGICPLRSIKSVENINIEVESGISVEAFKAKLNEKKTVKVTFSDKTVETVEVKPAFKTGGSRYTDFYEQFTALYPGDKGYNSNKTEPQSFIIYGMVDLSAYNGSDRYSVRIDISVKDGGCTVTFDAYGGVYLGEKTMKVKKNGAYGFSYDPAKIYREGYFFAGWYLVPGDNYDAVNRVWAKSICTSDVTLYAHWLKTFTGIVWEVSASSHSKGSITVKWDNIKTLYNGFEVEISRDGIIWSEPENVGKAKTKYYTGLESGKYYYVRVRAYRYDSAGKIVYGSWNNKLTKVKVK